MLNQALTIFGCQFITIVLLGMQSMNIRDGRKVAAAFTSLCLGIAGWNITSIISHVNHEGMLSLVFFGFVMSGPVGIVSSMFVHENPMTFFARVSKVFKELETDEGDMMPCECVF